LAFQSKEHNSKWFITSLSSEIFYCLAKLSILSVLVLSDI
jgi:hypothetical protein